MTDEETKQQEEKTSAPIYEDIGDDVESDEIVLEDEAGKLVLREFYDGIEMHQLVVNSLARLAYVYRKDGYKRRAVYDLLGVLFEEMDFDPSAGKHSLYTRCSEERAAWIRENCKPYQKR